MENKDIWIPNRTMGKTFFSVCLDFVNNDSSFSSFKRNPKFTSVIGNDIRDKEVSDIIYNNLISSKSYLLDKIDLFKTNDLYGDPKLYDYPEVGLISPGTLYFINVLKQIIEHFGDISKFNVVEIGSGYGGQSKIILDYGVNMYTCVDVNEPLQLCKKYLSLFKYSNVNYNEWNRLEDKEYDLVISNWCLSEFDMTGIQYYIDKIISKSKYGFFLMNIWDNRMKNNLINEMKNIFSYVETFQEVPKTHSKDNFLMIVKK